MPSKKSRRPTRIPRGRPPSPTSAAEASPARRDHERIAFLLRVPSEWRLTWASPNTTPLPLTPWTSTLTSRPLPEKPGMSIEMVKRRLQTRRSRPWPRRSTPNPRLPRTPRLRHRLGEHGRRGRSPSPLSSSSLRPRFRTTAQTATHWRSCPPPQPYRRSLGSGPKQPPRRRPRAGSRSGKSCRSRCVAALKMMANTRARSLLGRIASLATPRAASRTTSLHASPKP